MREKKKKEAPMIRIKFLHHIIDNIYPNIILSILIKFNFFLTLIFQYF